MDITARFTISSFVYQVLDLSNIIVITAVTAPYALVLAVLLAYPYYVVAQRYRWSARDLSRLESTTRCGRSRGMDGRVVPACRHPRHHVSCTHHSQSWGC